MTPEEALRVLSPAQQLLVPIANVFGLPAYFKGDIADIVFNRYLDVVVYFEVFYILLIYYGPKWMEKREPFKLKSLTTVWNLLLTLYSCGGAVGCVTLLMYLLETYGFYGTTCHFPKYVIYDGEYSFWIFAFLLSKFPEMIDTVFLVLQKKPLIFLHWYHHLTVAIFCWYAGMELIPSGIWYATMNYCVHSVMYLYYFCCSLGLRPYVRPIAPFITFFQLMQMVVGIIIISYTLYMTYFSKRGCNVDKRTIRLGIGMYGSYLVLFALLFVKLYLKKDNKKDNKKEKKA
ncbi:fatty acid elongase [Angomonas deanei]|uniref:Elongation of fatty acids protein n=1 Tax=Angomonas deanei TaxID=59799 RepID=A0A7G2CL62_9TRYP|nr:fatty acid elongase [Angomonas deanei]CAD2219303.1 GNS1/SUR4 family, putative [Angomonas deanei]|eukprot:EPY39127.1 fatty acid elongase [Angomonas deanei]